MIVTAICVIAFLVAVIWPLWIVFALLGVAGLVWFGFIWSARTRR